MNVPEAWRTQKARYRLEASIGSDGKPQFPPRLPKAGEVVRQAMAVRQQLVVDKSNGFDNGENSQDLGRTNEHKLTPDELPRTNGCQEIVLYMNKRAIGQRETFSDDLVPTNGGREMTANGHYLESASLAWPLLLEILGEAMRQTTDQEAAD